MKIVQLQLISKNNKKTGVYLYQPIVQKENKFYWAETIKTNKVIKISDINENDLIIRREIPKEFYQANNLINK